MAQVVQLAQGEEFPAEPSVNELVYQDVFLLFRAGREYFVDQVCEYTAGDWVLLDLAMKVLSFVAFGGKFYTIIGCV